MKRRGVISVFLVLLLTVISGFIITLERSVRGLVSRSEAVYAVDNAVRSCFAEYNRKLFDRYHILLIDSSYKGGDKGRQRVLDHFSTYLTNSLSQNMVCNTEVTQYFDASENNGEYLYMQAVGYARNGPGMDTPETDEDDGSLFRRYLRNVLGNHFFPRDTAVREGEIEYLIYGYDLDEDNIACALSECEEGDSISYEEHIRRRLEEQDEYVLRERFLWLIEEYMRENGSPAFDLAECYHGMTFTATLEGVTGERYVCTRAYAYGSEDM